MKLGDVEQAISLMQVRIDFEEEIGHRDLEKHKAQIERLRQDLKRM